MKFNKYNYWDVSTRCDNIWSFEANLVGIRRLDWRLLRFCWGYSWGFHLFMLKSIFASDRKTLNGGHIMRPLKFQITYSETFPVLEQSLPLYY